MTHDIASSRLVFTETRRIAAKPIMTSQESNAGPIGGQSITALLSQVNHRGDGAFARLVDVVYDDLRRVAAGRMRREFDRPLAALTESPTALVNQAILQLRAQRTQWQDREHYFAIATRLLGYVIGDYKKRRLAAKRGAGRRAAEPAERLENRPEEKRTVYDGPQAIEVIQALHEHHPRKAEVVTLHVLAGRSIPEVARRIGVSVPTAERDWKFAKAWIRDYLQSNGAS